MSGAAKENTVAGLFWGQLRRELQTTSRSLGVAVNPLVFLFLAMTLFALAAGGGLAGDLEPFRGGPSWQSWVYCTWEAVLCVGISLWLLRSFQEYFDRDGPLRARAARSAYTAYIIHPFFVVVGTWLLAALPIPVLARFGLLGAAAVVATFAVSDAVRRIPGVRRVV